MNPNHPDDIQAKIRKELRREAAEICPVRRAEVIWAGIEQRLHLPHTSAPLAGFVQPRDREG